MNTVVIDAIMQSLVLSPDCCRKCTEQIAIDMSSPGLAPVFAVFF